MSRKRFAVWVLALVVGITTRTAVAAPQASMAKIRAVTCCATHCPANARKPVAPRTCCFMGSPAGDPATASTAKTSAAPSAAAVVATLAPAAVIAAPAPIVAVAKNPVRAGPPVYLRSLALRL